MAYEIRVVEGERPAIEATLNESANEGWQLVSCWPEGKKVVGVFQRLEGVSSSRLPEAPKAAPTPSPKTALTPVTLETVLAACLVMPLKTTDDKGVEFYEGLSVEQFANQHGVTKEAMLAALQKLDLKAKKDKGDKKYRKFIGRDHSLWLTQEGKAAEWEVRIAKSPPPPWKK